MSPNNAQRRSTPVSEWSRGRARQVGVMVRHFRERWDLDIQDLVRATADMGHELPRMTISSLERGRRDSVSVAELLLLAHVLGVPPLVLLTGLGVAEETEVLPGATVSAPDAATWVAHGGHSPAAGYATGRLTSSEDAEGEAANARRVMEASAAAEEYRRLLAERDASGGWTPAQDERLEDKRAVAEARLELVRAYGLTPGMTLEHHR